MENYCKYNLDEINKLIVNLDQEQYTKPLHSLSNASIGQHVRHIIEFYLCLSKGLKEGVVSYDKRDRDLRLESDIYFTNYTISKIKSNLLFGRENKTFILEGDFSSSPEFSSKIETTYFRELAYCLEHGIHHQALIKVGLQEMNLLNLIDENFGVTPATIRFRASKSA